jgi:iron complex transport system ATP-binding protein
LSPQFAHSQRQAAKDATAASPLLSCQNLDIAIPGRCLVKELGFALYPGEVTCILGRNGAGKTLTLHTLAGLRSAAGELQLQGRDANSYPRKDLARVLAFVSQETPEAFPATVMETTVVGRHPHIGFWQWESERDFDLARAALATVDLNGFEDREVNTLSGGERRRLAIATALVQEPRLFILDEPTNHLDPQHQRDILKLLRAKADEGRAVLMSLHDPGLAARFADHALLLHGDGEWLYGPVSSALTPETLSRLYRTEVRELRWPEGRTFITA